MEGANFKEYGMKNFANLIASAIVAIWIVVIAIICTQNAESVSLKFLAYESVKIPFGLVFSFSVALGILITAVFVPVLSFSTTKTSRRGSLEEDPEFFADNEDF
jgi:uncharacterized integral membrane protein